MQDGFLVTSFDRLASLPFFCTKFGQMDAAAGLQGSGQASRSSFSSSSSNSSTQCLLPGSVIAVSPSHSLYYDCTDCGSFLFGHRDRLRPRPQVTRTSSHHHSTRGNNNTTNSNSSYRNSSSSNFISELAQSEDVISIVPTGISTNCSSDPVSDHVESDVEEVGDQTSRVMDFVACHGATPGCAAGPADTVKDSSATLAEICRCFICLGQVVDAQLCPCCSKLVCQSCIKRWLTDQKSECPHCRAPLLVSQLVSCRFISEISLEVEKIRGKLGEGHMEKKYCPAHDSPLLYFCTTCSVAVCSDCAVLIEDHRNHTFEKLSVAYDRHKKKIRMEAAGLRRRRKELSALVASVDKNIETVAKSKDESAAELQMAFKRMQARLEEQLKCKHLALLAQKGSMTQEMELLDTVLQELDQQLNSIPKSDLIAQEPNMSRMLQDIRNRAFSDISRTPIPPEFTSEVVPSYEHGELILKNYKENLTTQSSGPTTVVVPGGNPNSSSEALLSMDVVYSELICGSGVAWRLKVYPNGSGASQGTHLSVFLEMVEGGNEAATYEYGIELLHPSRPNQRIIRRFSSDFEAGACWGYYQFVRIDLLEKEGYLTAEEDTITLRFFVRPLTYQQQCRDLRRALAALQVERDESATQVAVIRKAFAATFFQRRGRRSSRAAGHVANQQAAVAQAVIAAAGAGSNVLSSPTLTVRKPNTLKHGQTKMIQDCNAMKTSNTWLSGTTNNPQAEGHHHHHNVHPSASTIENLINTDSPPTSQPTPHLNHSTPETLDRKPSPPPKTSTPPNTRSITHPKDREATYWPTKKLGDQEQFFFHTPKLALRSHTSGKMRRSRSKVNKQLVLADDRHETTPPRFPDENLPATTRLAQHLVADAGPSLSSPAGAHLICSSDKTVSAAVREKIQEVHSAVESVLGEVEEKNNVCV